MRKIASGHIAFWEGGGLWVFDVPSSPGAPKRNATHAHHAFQLTFSLGGTFGLHMKDCVLPGPAALVAPDTPHAFEASGLVALLFVEPESHAGRALTKLAAARPAMPIGAEQTRQARSLIDEALRSADRRAALRETGMEICRRIAGHVQTVDLDRRVRLMIRWAHDNLDRAPAINEAAGHVGLSPSRASHLFVEQTGLPFRAYVLWLRLVRAVDAHAKGLSLTEAAHEAGFADSAHLSRAFRRMFGLPAASLELS